jgi:signal transduction histidine kinase
MAPEKVRFKYKLDGLEEDWTDVGAKRFAQYSYLPPRDYRFRVIACNNDGVWNTQGASLAFTVLPFVWQTWWFQASSLGSGVGAVGAGAFWISRRRIRRRLELSERQHALERERARIARDIHDDLGASLTRITLLSQSIRSEVEGQSEATAEVDQIYDTARQLTRAMDEIVWAVNPKHDTLDSLVSYLGRFAQHFLAAAPIRCRLDVPLSLPSWALTSEIRHNTFLAFKEALNNVVKHAAATEVRVSLELHPNGFVLSVVDNGRGFKMNLSHPSTAGELESSRLASGYGLANMKKRMEEIGGNCEWTTSPGEGTRVKLRVVVNP